MILAAVIFAGCSETEPEDRGNAGDPSKPLKKAETETEDGGNAGDPSKPLKKAELLVELPDQYDTPDGMCLLPNGEVIVAVPNVNSFMA
ncbi:MAG: hypothetical protein QGH41_06590, partial [Roseibacillus sp.]|nr:hypothetical protein [Roseibacillus sp.]